MQDQESSEDARTPEEAEKLAREVMKRMLATPPSPHVPKEKAAKKKTSKKD